MKRALTDAQRAVLEWLLAYPGVEIGWAGPGERAEWTAAWASEDARLHMVRTLAALEPLLGPQDAERTGPRTAPIPGPTPRLTTPTFEALLRRGFVRGTRYRPADGVWSAMWWWGISRRGVAAIRPLGMAVP